MGCDGEKKAQSQGITLYYVISNLACIVLLTYNKIMHQVGYKLYLK